jgi:hypothetical protein
MGAFSLQPSNGRKQKGLAAGNEAHQLVPRCGIFGLPIVTNSFSWSVAILRLRRRICSFSARRSRARAPTLAPVFGKPGSKVISLSRKIVLPSPWPIVDNKPLT